MWQSQKASEWEWEDGRLRNKGSKVEPSLEVKEKERLGALMWILLFHNKTCIFFKTEKCSRLNKDFGRALAKCLVAFKYYESGWVTNSIMQLPFPSSLPVNLNVSQFKLNDFYSAFCYPMALYYPSSRVLIQSQWLDLITPMKRKHRWKMEQGIGLSWKMLNSTVRYGGGLTSNGGNTEVRPSLSWTEWASDGHCSWNLANWLPTMISLHWIKAFQWPRTTMILLMRQSFIIG